jgi:gas vesicle protein
MGKAGNSIATLLLGAAVGVAVGYLLATDQETRQEDMDKIKKSLESLKSKVAKKGMDVEEEIYHS